MMNASLLLLLQLGASFELRVLADLPTFLFHGFL